MNQRFEFDATEVLALLAESHEAKERLLTEAQRYLAAGFDLRSEDPRLLEEVEHPATGAPAGLWLMNDHGVYLRSNARDRDGEKVVHAEGYRTDLQVGEEPLCEFISAESLERIRPGDTLVVTVGEDKLRLSLIRAE